MNFYVFPNLLQNTSVSYIIYCIYKLKKSSGLNLKIGSSLSGTSPFLDTNLTNHDMQLKHWLDQTEVELGRRLASRATSFLAAVSAQDQLKNILKEAQETAQSLRARVRQVGVSGTKSNFSGKQMFGRSYFFYGHSTQVTQVYDLTILSHFSRRPYQISTNGVCNAKPTKVMTPIFPGSY